MQMCRRHLQWFTEELAGIVERRREEIKLIPQVLDVTSLMKKLHLEPQEVLCVLLCLNTPTIT